MCTFLFFEVLLFIWFAGIGTWFASDGGEASELLGSCDAVRVTKH